LIHGFFCFYKKIFFLRIGHIPQNLRAKEQRIYSVRWLSPSKYILATGSDLGKIALWDIR